MKFIKIHRNFFISNKQNSIAISFKFTRIILVGALFIANKTSLMSSFCT